ncbi:MAG: hypothetical protein IJY04_02630 [Clostridia bacterium]|nr:hypothetical protein [Clostridia bacterium]
MGIENFYMSVIGLTDDDREFLMSEYTNLIRRGADTRGQVRKERYAAAFRMFVPELGEDTGKEIWINATREFFLPACLSVWEILSRFRDRVGEFTFESKREKRRFDFESRYCFVCYMYGLWEKELDTLYDQMGCVMFLPDEYYKKRNRLYRKYYRFLLK